VEDSSRDTDAQQDFSGSEMLGGRESPNMTNGHKNEKFIPKPRETRSSELEGQKMKIRNQLDSLSRLDPTTRDLGNADARKQIQLLEEELLKLRGVARELVDSFRQSLEQKKQKLSRKTAYWKMRRWMSMKWLKPKAVKSKRS
jgi:hypothetical protein